MTTALSIAYFITYHGFGHASRSAAVLAALEQILPQVRFELFTDCPSWIFNDTLTRPFGYHPERVDVGMVQSSPFESDPLATCRALDAWVPFDSQLVGNLCKQIDLLDCRIVVSDISPLGLAVARQAGVPGVLIENFTWDWIYKAYLPQVPVLKKYIEYYKEIYLQADLRIQTEPICCQAAGAVYVPPVGRRPRTPRRQIRARLKIPMDADMVLVSMGGIPDRFHFLKTLPHRIDPYIVVTGVSNTASLHPKVIPLTTTSSFYHPDLLQASDLIIGKAGYSTIAETYLTSVAFGYILRSDSPESPVLERFIRESLSAQPVAAETYQSGCWLETLSDLAQLPRRPLPKENGADVIAGLLRDRYFKA